MLQARMEHSAVATNGMIYVFGGRDADGRGVAPLTSVEAYNPSGDRWEKLRDLPFPLYQAGVEALGDKIFLFGGLTSQNELPSRAVLVYHIPRDTFFFGGPLPSPRHAMGVARHDRTITIIGGLGKNADEYLADGLFFDAERYRPTPLLPIPLAMFGIAQRNGVVWTVGGINRGLVDQLYALKGERWEGIATLPAPAGKLSCAFMGDTLVIAGGFGRNRAGEPSQILKDVRGYITEQDEWLELPDMKYARAALATVELYGKVYVIGGLNFQRSYQRVVLNNVEVLDNLTGANAEEPLPTAHNLVTVHPNPTNGPINFTLPATSVQVNIFDLAGRAVASQILPQGRQWSWQTDDRNAGVYIYEVLHANGKKITTGKFVVLK